MNVTCVTIRFLSMQMALIVNLEGPDVGHLGRIKLFCRWQKRAVFPVELSEETGRVPF